ncbi:DUF7563 family protein [Halosolutus halophilus]
MVSSDFVRVFGDNRGRIDGCVHCLTSSELTGDAAESGFLPPAV